MDFAASIDYDIGKDIWVLTLHTDLRAELLVSEAFGQAILSLLQGGYTTPQQAQKLFDSREVKG